MPESGINNLRFRFWRVSLSASVRADAAFAGTLWRDEGGSDESSG